MTINELLEEVESMRRKTLQAYFDSPNPGDYKNLFNPWYDRRRMFLSASLIYADLSSTISWIKEETNV